MSKQIRNQSTRCKSIYVTMILFILQLCFNPTVYALEKKVTDENEKNNVFNIYDAERGRITREGIIYNQQGRILGSVDSDGKIYNISKINIGKVEADGTVRNQSDTKLGHVNENGEIFNVSSRKIGQVEDIKDIKLIGGAARLLFF